MLNRLINKLCTLANLMRFKFIFCPTHATNAQAQQALAEVILEANNYVYHRGEIPVAHLELAILSLCTLTYRPSCTGLQQ